MNDNCDALSDHKHASGPQPRASINLGVSQTALTFNARNRVFVLPSMINSTVRFHGFQGSTSSMNKDSFEDTGYDSVPALSADASPISLPSSPMESVPPSPPPPPPVPHHLQKQISQNPQKLEESSSIARKFKSAPPRWLTSGYTLDDHMPSEPYEFRKVSYFFYGTLQDPKILSHILEKHIESSSLRPASIVGYSCELWGTYKALVDGPMGAVVKGLAYEVQCEEDELRLAAYETNAYETVSCRIDLKDPSEAPATQTISGKTFRYAGDPDALREKRFDRKLWVKNMAPEFRSL